jgi:hypothetical protein
MRPNPFHCRIGDQFEFDAYILNESNGGSSPQIGGAERRALKDRICPQGAWPDNQA